ncbi:tetratricopeptide repeat protein [Pontibacter diazotrophicus]|uniref:Tetratricopeptide repeat protein n=1 Tax=Pontibacter diazotrophicus TaxID=1400979 RepID=A0A3D8LH86_9BACT|nr:DUF6377 domain-containing protein [Pontibacter diazotrophicus]RDV16809.1 tetratricopeptide repeat protein [Pontibacter diazotrophicus]
MKLLSVLLVLFLCAIPALSAETPDSLLQELSQAIENREAYIQQKSGRIGRLKGILNENDDVSLLRQFEVYKSLYDEYRSYKYDSAFTYAQKLQETARQMQDSTRMTQARLSMSFILLSSGMFKEAFDTLDSVNIANKPGSLKVDYYAQKARGFYDLASYNQDKHYASQYIAQGGMYVDSALALTNQNSLQFYSLRGMKHEASGNYEQAKTDFQMILDEFDPTLHQYAMASHSLGNIHRALGNTDKALEMMAKAAIADIKSSTTEAVALMNLAELLYNNGDEARAYTYIKQALQDADFYGARQRKIQVAAILPIIEGERLVTVEGQRRSLLLYAIAVTLLSLLVVAFAFIIFRQLKQLRQAKQTVTDANQRLQEINDKLLEANIIKEEYIGHSFNVYSEYIKKLEKFKESVENKLRAKKYDEIPHVLKTINLKKEREALYTNFDKIFMKLFPDFVSVFNSYFPEEDKIVTKSRDSLNVELRIFALIRIGIHDHEQIARILEYSVSTIYNYKTKVKNKSILPNEEFEKKIMEIKPF